MKLVIMHDNSETYVLFYTDIIKLIFLIGEWVT